jgi:hypothetical protein
VVSATITAVSTTTIANSLLTGAAALLVVVSSSGCFLPVSTAAPQSATTVGKGNVGATLYGEFPTVDLLSTQTDDDDDSEGYGMAPLPTATFQLAYGITDKADLEVALDGVLYIIIPLPLGGSIGGRLQLIDRDKFAVAASGRVGYVGLGVNDSLESDSEREVGVSAAYTSITMTAQFMPRGFFRPAAAMTFMPARVTNEIRGETPENFTATTMSVTLTGMLGLGPLEAGPFINLVHFSSPNLAGTTSFATGGIMLALRGSKDREQPEPLQPPPVDPGESWDAEPGGDAPAGDAPPSDWQ